MAPNIFILADEITRAFCGAKYFAFVGVVTNKQSSLDPKKFYGTCW
jgi:hypothetical protein